MLQSDLPMGTFREFCPACFFHRLSYSLLVFKMFSELTRLTILVIQRSTSQQTLGRSLPHSTEGILERNQAVVSDVGRGNRERTEHQKCQDVESRCVWQCSSVICSYNLRSRAICNVTFPFVMYCLWSIGWNMIACGNLLGYI